MDNLEVRKNLKELEAVIEKGLEEFHRVGLALLEIRERKLYEPDFETFNDYCKVKWNISGSMGYHLTASADVMGSLEGDILPTKSSHAAKLHVIKDDGLRNRAWNEILDTGEEITGRLVEIYAKKYWLVENSKEFGSLVLQNTVTPDHAIDVYKRLRVLPTYYKEIYLKHPTIDSDCLIALRQLEFEYQDEFLSIVNTGFLDNGRDNIPLGKLTSRDIDAYYRRLKWEESQSRQQVVNDTQKEEIEQRGMLLLSGLEIAEKLAENAEHKAMIYAFPEGEYTPTQIAKILENYGYGVLFMAIYTKQEPDLRLNGNLYIKPSQVNGQKPQYFLDAFKNSILPVG